MLHQFTEKNIGSIFAITDDFEKNENRLKIQNSLVKIFWNKSSTIIKIRIDDTNICLMPNQIITLTYLHYISFDKSNTSGVTAFVFNKEFYCMQQHDDEVSCYGILFFGAQSIPIINIDGDEIKKFNLLYEVFLDEFTLPDSVQGQMLEVLLKRLIIKCTRIARTHVYVCKPNSPQIEVIRKFNLLVEIHFKTKKKVSDYADLLCKSPKTLSNLFAIHQQRTPQQIIHDRVILDAKRLLCFTEKSIKEISFELGFTEASHFTKFFKNITSKTPIEYKKSVSI